MDFTLYLAFIIASIALIIVPGPNVLVIVSTSATHGTRKGLQTVLGTSSAMLIQLTIAAAGTAWFVDYLSSGFQWLRWLGIGYLLFLGISHLRKILTVTKVNEVVPSTTVTFSRGFIVSLTNPKTIIFFSAFLPQFIMVGGPYNHQIMVLSATFLILATLFDSLYAILAGKAHRYLEDHTSRKLQHGISGGLILGASIWLALARKG